MRVQKKKLFDTDLIRRLNFANCFLQGNQRFVKNIMIGDEAAFHLNGKVKDHNVRMYVPKNQPPDSNYDVGISRENLKCMC